jgi:hypothetical protein
MNRACKTIQRSTSLHKVIEEDNDFFEAVEEVEIESEEDSHGATDGKTRELYVTSTFMQQYIS